MASFVVVHGAWGGGWEWSPVARLLRARGHDVLTPTLSGLGDRAHVGRTERIGLAIHVEDLTALADFEDLDDVVMVAASYGGMPATGAADAVAPRVRSIVYVDALVPRDGQAAADLLPEPFVAAVRAGLAEHGDRWRVPMPPQLFDALLPPGSTSEEARAAYARRLRDHPAASFVDPVRLTGAVDRLRRSFVRCTASQLAETVGGDPIEACAARARDEGWPYRELAVPHDPQIYDPAGIAALVEELATA